MIYTKTDNNNNVYLDRDYVYENITVPKEYYADGNSVPRLLRIVVGKREYPQAYFIHDYGYKNGLLTRKELDIIYKDALIMLGVNKYLSNILYWGLRIFGKKNYETHTVLQS